MIGRVYLARSWYSNLRPSIGTAKPAAVPAGLDYDLWQGPAPRVPYVDNRIHYNWHWFWHWGNGELGNNGIHALDLCRWGLGVDFPIRVTSSGGRYRYDDDQETPDTQTVCFEFEGRRQITWEGLSCNKHDAQIRDVLRRRRSAGPGRQRQLHGLRCAGQGSRQVGSPSVGDNEHIVNLLDAIRDDKPLSLNAEIEEGHKSTLLCHLGNIAHRTGRTLTCDPSNGHIVGDDAAMKLAARIRTGMGARGLTVSGQQSAFSRGFAGVRSNGR